MNKTLHISHITIIRLVSALVVIISVLMAYQISGSAKASTVVLEWDTASEVDTAGFNIYRGERSQGPYEKVNDNLIPASNDALVGGSYTYEDVNVVAGRIYYYQLEDVAYSGETTRHGPIEIEARREGSMVLALAGVLALVGVAGFFAGPRYLRGWIGE
jgi:hypothetical protein